MMFIQFVWVHAVLIRQSCDTEMNPRPRPNSCHNFSICYQNVNVLTARSNRSKCSNYLKVLILHAYVSIEKFDVVCLSDTYLNSFNLSDDDNFNLCG